MRVAAPAGLLVLALPTSTTLQVHAHMTRSTALQMSWSDSDWQWGSAEGKAHEAAAQLRGLLSTTHERERFLTGIGMMDPEDWKDSKLALALTIQRASKRCYAKAYGLEAEEQASWRALMDAMAACEFEGYRGDLRLAEAIIERLGLIEGKRLSAL